MTTSETLILGINPTFYLKKIEPLIIPTKLLQGDFKKINLSSLLVNQTSTTPVITELAPVEVISTNPLSKRYTFNDRNNNTFTCITTNNFSFDSNSLICQWCRRPFSHSWVGIPYRLESSESTNTYYTDGCYCCTQCAAGELKERSRLRANRYHGLFVTADVLLEHLHDQIYPNVRLKAAPHFYHHQANGGALTDQEFYGEKTPFVETTGIVLIPTKKVSIMV